MIEYRALKPDEEEAVLQLWLSVFEDTELQQWRREFQWDAHRFERTCIAVENGTILASARVSLQFMRDADGKPRRVGYVSSVATLEAERGKGHAGELLKRLIDVMRDADCEWSVLSAEDTRLYEKHGWRAYPYTVRQGNINPVAVPSSTHFEIVELALTREDYDTLATLYKAYNAQRPLSTVRDRDYWLTYCATRLDEWREAASAIVLLARHGDQPCGYIVGHPSARGFLMTELAVLPGYDQAIPALFHPIHAKTLELGGLGGRVFLPSESVIDSYIAALFDGMHTVTDSYTMVRPLTSSDDSEIEAAFNASGGRIWLIDSY